MDVVLPIGISFHIFQSFAYVMDVLYGRVAPCRNFVHYALYVSWFPQLVAGPIERPGHLLPQLAAIGEGKAGFASRLPHAAALFAEGWIRKLAADVLSATADAFFDAPAGASTSDAVLGIVAFGLQIYGDFSGYTRMAQGVEPRPGRRPRGELRPALRGAELPGVLAALAHLALDVVPRLRLHPARRQPQGPGAGAGEHRGHHAPERPVARRGLDLPALGSDARRVHGAGEREPRLLAARARGVDGARWSGSPSSSPGFPSGPPTWARCSRATAPWGTGGGRRRRSASCSGARSWSWSTSSASRSWRLPPAQAAGWRGWALGRAGRAVGGRRCRGGFRHAPVLGRGREGVHLLPVLSGPWAGVTPVAALRYE